MQTAILAVAFSLSAVGCHHRGACTPHRAACYSGYQGGCFGGVAQTNGGGWLSPFRGIMGARNPVACGAPVVRNAPYGTYTTPSVPGASVMGASYGYGAPVPQYYAAPANPYATPVATYNAPAPPNYGAPAEAGRTYTSAYGPAPATNGAAPVNANLIPGTSSVPDTSSSSGLLPHLPNPSVPPAPAIPGAPSIPAAPGIPGAPNIPSAPAIPAVPSIPTIPGTPR